MNNDVFIAAFVDELEKLAGFDDVFWEAFSDEMEKMAVGPLLVDAAKWMAKAPFRAVGSIPYGARRMTPGHAPGQVIGTKKTWYGGTKPRVAKGYTRMTVGRKAKSLYKKIRHPIKTIKQKRRARRRAGRHERSLRVQQEQAIRERPAAAQAAEALEEIKRDNPGKKDKWPSEVRAQADRLQKKIDRFSDLKGDVELTDAKIHKYHRQFGKPIKPSKVKAVRRKLRGIKEKVLGKGPTPRATPPPARRRAAPQTRPAPSTPQPSQPATPSTSRVAQPRRSPEPVATT